MQQILTAILVIAVLILVIWIGTQNTMNNEKFSYRIERTDPNWGYGGITYHDGGLVSAEDLLYDVGISNTKNKAVIDKLIWDASLRGFGASPGLIDGIRYYGTPVR